MEIGILKNGKLDRVRFRPGETILEVLRENGYEVSAVCGGRGACGKCKIFITDKEGEREVLSCKTPAAAGMIVRPEEETLAGERTVVRLKEDRSEPIDEILDVFCRSPKRVGLVLDVGTTTLEYLFLDPGSGKTLWKLSRLNPQRAFGADVISRISYAAEHGVRALTKVLRESVNSVIGSVLGEWSAVRSLYVTGNTVMLHTFAGEEIDSFGRAPFTPVFLNKREFTGEELGIRADKILCLPSFSSFVGADVVCGGLAADITRRTSLLADIGTNGELLLFAKGKLYTASVAAGPAFEGAGIECGMGGVDGAICSVRLRGSGFECDVIGGGSPRGICGSGLIDAAACLLESGAIDETGAMNAVDGRVYLAQDVYLSARDVRAFQLAKSAVCAGILTLLKTAGIAARELDRLYIAGNLGYYIDKRSAVKVGLIPKELYEKIEVIGNSAVKGAAMCLCSVTSLQKAETLARSAENVDLSVSGDFTEAFMENMFF